MPSNDRVGYRNPPKKTRFKKGVSGNPRGRPKGTRNLATDLKDELEERVTVRESGRPRRLSKQQVLIKTLMAKALQGDLKAAAAILNIVLRLDLGAQEAPVGLTPDDELVLNRFGEQVLARLKQKLEARKK